MRLARIGIALAIVAASCGGGKKDLPVSTAGFEQINADQLVVGFAQYVTEAGLKKAEVHGDTAFIYEDSSVAKVKHVQLRLYDEKGQLSARLQSDSGNVNNATQAMIARGNVVLITSDGSRIETSELYYDPQKHRIWSDKPTTKRDANGTLSGSGFEADDKFNNVRVLGARTSGGGLRIQF